MYTYVYFLNVLGACQPAAKGLGSPCGGEVLHFMCKCSSCCYLQYNKSNMRCYIPSCRIWIVKSSQLGSPRLGRMRALSRSLSLYTYIYIYIHIYIYTYMYHICTMCNIRKYVCVCVYTYIYIYIYTYASSQDACMSHVVAASVHESAALNDRWALINIA